MLNCLNSLYVVCMIEVAFVMLLSVSYITNVRGSGYPSVLPPTSRVQGLSYGEWLAQWWECALMIPAQQNPLTSGEKCVLKSSGTVGLVIANPWLNEPISCKIPVGMMLFIEVLGVEFSNIEEPPFYGEDEEALRACAQAFIPQDLSAAIDGVEVENLSKFIFLSPVFQFTAPENNILAVPAGTAGKSISSGAYLMFAPLSIGKHTIHLKGTYPDLGYTAEKIFHFTAVSRGNYPFGKSCMRQAA